MKIVLAMMCASTLLACGGASSMPAPDDPRTAIKGDPTVDQVVASTAEPRAADHQAVAAAGK